MRGLLLGLLALLLVGCSIEAWNNKLSTPEERAFAEQSVKAIRAGDMKWLAQRADVETMGDLSARGLEQLRSGIPDGPAKLMTVNSNTIANGGGTRTYKAFNYEMGAGQRWAIVQVLVRPEGSNLLISGFRFWRAERSPSAANAFSFEGKGAVHYLWIVLMVASALTAIGTFLLILRTRGLRLKWLWAIGSLFGFCTFQLNWTTGAWGMWPISVQLLGVSAMQNGPLMPWVMGFAPPLVAIAFLIWRALRSPEKVAEAEADAFE